MLVVENMEELIEKLKKWKEGMEKKWKEGMETKGLLVNTKNTKIMVSSFDTGFARPGRGNPLFVAKGLVATLSSVFSANIGYTIHER